jgi:hypothetical protein
MGPEPTSVTRQPQEGRGSGLLFGLLALVGILIVGIGGGGAWWFFLRTEPGTIHLATDPPDAVVYLDNQPVTSSTSSPFVLAGVEPGEHLVEVRKHGFNTWATRVDLENGQTLELPAVSLVAEGSGAAVTDGGGGTGGSVGVPAIAGTGFHFDTVPSGAIVFVDDTQISQITPATVTDMTPGTHTIRAEVENYAPWSGQIDVAANVITELPRAVLTLRQVSVRFESDPPVNVTSVADALDGDVSEDGTRLVAVNKPPGEKTVIVICTVAGLAIASFETLVILGVIEWIPFWLR